MNDYFRIQQETDRVLSSKGPVKDKLLAITHILKTSVEKYTWVGFYFMNNLTRELHLGPYTGNETEHKIIPFGKGICGQVAVSGETYLSADVAAEENYIACSMDVRSEIVLPIYHHTELIAQLDIDSIEKNAFKEVDQKFLADICIKLGNELGAEMHFERLDPDILD